LTTWKSASLLVFEGVQEGKESFGTVLTSMMSSIRDQGRNGQDNKVTILAPAQKIMITGNQGDEEGRAGMGLLENKHIGDAHNDQIRQKSLEEGLSFSLF
jgi:hypothetical protein